MLKNIPNALTIIRFILIPFIVYYILTGQYIAGFIVLTISGLTDILDGCIARKFNFITNFGKLIDPLADKLTQVSLLLALTILEILPWWILAIVFIKECVMVIAASVLYSRKDVVVYSKWYGKLATCLFYLAIICSLIINQFNIKLSFRIDLYLYYLAILATIFSLVMYSIKFKFKAPKEEK